MSARKRKPPRPDAALVLVRQFVKHFDGPKASQLGNGFAQQWYQRAKALLWHHRLVAQEPPPVSLWKVRYRDEDDGHCTEWFTTEPAALTRHRELMVARESGQVFGEPQRVEIPTQRKALADFLTGYTP